MDRLITNNINYTVFLHTYNVMEVFPTVAAHSRSACFPS